MADIFDRSEFMSPVRASGSDTSVSTPNISWPAPYHSKEYMERDHGARPLFVNIA
jgi:hypothetical protein